LTDAIPERLAALRAEMATLDLDALVVPRADEYLGEYLPERNERLRWVTGFSGSAGVAIVLADSAAIFVDGRYTVQVAEQVDSDCFETLHLVDEPHVAWLGRQLAAGARVGCDARAHSWRWFRQARQTLAGRSVELVALDSNPIDRCWHDRPPASAAVALLLEERYTGAACADKRRRLGEAVAAAGAEAALVFAADSAAWLLNLRGRDVPRVPVVLGLGLLHADGRFDFFTDPAKLPAGAAAHFGEGVNIRPEPEADAALAELAGRRVLFDPETANAHCRLVLEAAGAELVEGDDPTLVPRASKNPVEVQGMRESHVRDGVAEVKFLAWLDGEVAAGRLHDEALLSDRIDALRAEQALFQEPSFDTISAAGPNAAMAHYNFRNGSAATLAMDSVYLVDSGGHYLDGTTDITRTVAIGDPGAEARRMFTLVLKGHIALDQARFPAGTTGGQLDVLARQHLWRENLDYDHGTGHGVGSYLSVHEGPQRIGKTGGGAELRPGMVVSNEPGYYRAGGFGIRCENLVVVTEQGESPDTGRMTLGFEALTMAPFDLRLIEPDLLEPAEVEWLNGYHALVRDTLSPMLDEAEQAWLAQATRPI
jgi:Xaa-Pro aminopeptidase